MAKSPFSSGMMNTFVDRLIRYELLRHALGEDPHPCLDVEAVLLAEAELPIRASADACRRSPAWPMVRTWFSMKFREIALGRLRYYEFPHDVGDEILLSLESRGFDHLLEKRSGTSDVWVSPGSNVMSSGQWKSSSA